MNPRIKVAVILENSAECELDRKIVTFARGHDDDVIDLELSDAIESFVLSIGDTIKIREVQD